MAAATAGDEPTVRTLLERGADPNAANKDGWTALMAAADHGYTAVAEALLGKNADPAAVNNEKKTALTYAEAGQHQDIVALLQTHTEARGTTGTIPASSASAAGKQRGQRARSY